MNKIVFTLLVVLNVGLTNKVLAQDGEFPKISFLLKGKDTLITLEKSDVVIVDSMSMKIIDTEKLSILRESHVKEVFFMDGNNIVVVAKMDVFSSQRLYKELIIKVIRDEIYIIKDGRFWCSKELVEGFR